VMRRRAVWALLAAAAWGGWAGQATAGELRFEEVGQTAGARIRHHARKFSGKHADVLGMFTSGGAAAAAADYDDDGDVDLFVVDSGAGKPHHLLRNELVPSGRLTFTDRAAAAGVTGGNDAKSIVSDALWLDADNDGHRDLLLARFGTPLLFRNRGDGTFEDVSAASGLDKFGNSIAALAFDYDGDGRLDLVLANYFPPVDLIDLPTPHVLPDNLDDARNGGGVTLWQNVTAPGSKKIRFVEVTAAAGLSRHTGWTLDAGHADLDNDGDQDLYLAGDYGTDRLFRNNGDGTFRDVTKEAIGFDTKKGMNVDVADYDRDGWLDVYVTNITDEYMKECNMLWHNDGDGTFTDLSKETGTCNTLWGWAAKFADFDNDGWEDLFAANGLRSAGKENYIPVLVEMILRPGVDFTDLNSWPAIGDMSWSGYQKKKLFRNLGEQTFKEVSAEAGVDNDRDGRGVAVADFDNDGRLDFYQTNADQDALLYRNISTKAGTGTGRWLGLQLIGTKSNRDAVGARATVRAGGQTWIREVNGGNGYASQSAARLHFGLGTTARIDSIEVRWPSGRKETVSAPLDRITTIREALTSDLGLTPQARAYRSLRELKSVPSASPAPGGAAPSSLGREPQVSAHPDPADISARAEKLWHHRNLGKAFYENPTTQYEAVEELRQALELAPDSPRERLNYALALLRAGKTAEGVAELQKVQKQAPDLPHTWFNLGVAYKRESQYDQALAQLEGMIARVPDEPVSHYNLGTLYKLTDKPELALKHFEEAARLGPGLAGPRFQLFNAYKKAGRAADSARELAKFKELKAAQEGAAIPEDLEWSWYSEILDEIEPRPLQRGDFLPASSNPKLDAAELATGLDPATAALHVLDGDGDGRPDLLAASAAGLQLWRGGRERAAATGLEEIRGVVAVAPGDFDNDGLADLAVLAPAPSLWRNAGGRFEKVAANLPAQGPTGSFRLAVWLDFDHDYDLDLVLLGEGAALLRNQGPAGWSDETARFPFVRAPATAAAVLDVVADSQGIDLAVAYAGRGGVLYRDRLGGVYEAEPLDALPAGARFLLAEDVDHDGWTDLVAPGRLVRNERSPRGRLVAGPELPGSGPAVLADLENSGAAGLVTADRISAAPLVALAAADFDADGRVDLATVGEDGVLRRLQNVTATSNRWLTVGLAGVKNLKLAPGSEVEVKAGSLYQKKLYRGLPLHFGLGSRAEVDTVRITWPNGLIQNETGKAAGALAFEEAPRLSGSCPMIFTWNGHDFEFITDVLGVAPLGASAGDGTYFPVDHDEYVQIRGESLALVDGGYEIRITEELREVAYLDQVRLLAVDHPADVEVFTNDKFKAPPFPDFRLFGVRQKIRPVRARDHRGADVRGRLLARDRAYPDGFRRNAAGIAELHSLDLDFGDAAPDGRAILVLSGWVDWADGSTFLGAAQESRAGLVFPSLQVKDAAGEWRTVIEDLGIPAGKPKTIVVDLTDKFLSASREVRIVTSLCVYWDEIFLAAAAGEPEAVLSGLPVARAALRYRGFSRPVIHPERKQPESFDYQSWMPVSMWNPTPGLYTRYGDVRPLLAEIDDRLVVMGSGDEIRLRFDAAALPPLPAGWRRDFLLFVDGWAKDADANTAFSQTVEPLPFHGMSQYPYPEGERFPGGEVHDLDRQRSRTRPALRLLHPLRAREEARE
jgi:enediyne biosynthesis protein E4